MFKKMYGLSRQSISLGFHLYIQAELKGTSTILVVTVTEGHSGRRNCIMKHICACFLRGSLRQNREVPKDCSPNIAKNEVGDKVVIQQCRTMGFQYPSR
jgi:hypothetical protein